MITNKIINIFKYITSIALCIVIFTAYFPTISFAVTAEDLNNANSSVDNLQNEKSSLSDRLDSLNSELTTVTSKLTEINSQIASVQNDIDNLNAALEELEISQYNQYEAMKKRIQYMYENNSTSLIEILISSGSLSDFLRKSEYISNISSYDRDMLNKLQETHTTIANNTASLQNKAIELEALRADAQEKQENINSLIADAQQAYNTASDSLIDAQEKALALEKTLNEEYLQAELEQIEAEKNNGNSGSNNEEVNNPDFSGSYSQIDIAMLAAIIECEAGGEPYEGKLAVGSTVLNRVSSPRFPNSIAEVLYQPKQFSPVASGRFAIVLARGASTSCYEAALSVLNGNITINALFFHVYRPGEIGGTIIGNHIFF